MVKQLKKICLITSLSFVLGLGHIILSSYNLGLPFGFVLLNILYHYICVCVCVTHTTIIEII